MPAELHTPPRFYIEMTQSFAISKASRRLVFVLKVHPVESNVLSLSLCEILVPQPGIKPVPLPEKAWSPNHWTTRELPSLSLSLYFGSFLFWRSRENKPNSSFMWSVQLISDWWLLLYPHFHAHLKFFRVFVKINEIIFVKLVWVLFKGRM